MSDAKALRASPPFLMSLPQWVTPQPAGEGLFSICVWEEGELELAMVQSATAEIWGWAVLASVKGVLLSLAWAASSIIFVMAKVLSWQQKFCRGKHTFVATKHIFCRNKFVAAKIILVAAPTNHSLCSVKSLGKVLSTVKPKPFFIRDASQVLLYVVL